MAVPKSVTISPGETEPARKLTAFTTLLMVGSGAVTTRVALIVIDPPAPPVPLTTMLPGYEPAPSVPGVAATVSEAVPVVGVVPLMGVTESQVPLVTAAEKAMAAPPPETVMVCVDGLTPPAWYWNVRMVGDVTLMVGAAVTVKLTGTVTATIPFVPVPFGVTVMVAV